AGDDHCADPLQMAGEELQELEQPQEVPLWSGDVGGIGGVSAGLSGYSREQGESNQDEQHQHAQAQIVQHDVGPELWPARFQAQVKVVIRQGGVTRLAAGRLLPSAMPESRWNTDPMV